jgi:quercetin dioxygenase-like cupin family protein
MQFPEFMQAFPALDVPFPEDVVTSSAVQSDAGLVVFFTFHKDMELPPHAHKAQWGTVIEGELILTIGGVTKTYRPGDSYSIPSGVEHGAKVKAGSKVMDVFEESDRYPLRS